MYQPAPPYLYSAMTATDAAPTIATRKLRRWVHRAIVGTVGAPPRPVPAVTAEGWLCERCGVRVPLGQDRTRHYVPGH